MIVSRFNPIRILDEVGPSLHAAIERVLSDGVFIGGEEVEAFEGECEAYLGCGAAIACASGTDAIELALRALGLPPRAAVAVPAFTFTATVSAVVAAGLQPLFVDVDPRTFQICPIALATALDRGVSAVVAVSLYGMPLDDAIFSVCRASDVFVIEDACQSFGAGSRDTRNRATLTAYSFFPTKPLGCLGDGGMVTTCDLELASRVRLLGRHGFGHRKHLPLEPGRNSRLDAVQAAVMRAKLPFVDRWRERREQQAARYTTTLTSAVSTPLGCPGHAWSLYSIRSSRRDELRHVLRSSGIHAEVFYPVGLHRTPAFSSSVDLPATDDATREVLCLPISASITQDEQDYVIDRVLDWSSSRE